MGYSAQLWPRTKKTIKISAYVQRFNFRSVVLPEISIDGKNVTYNQKKVKVRIALYG